MLVQAMAFRDYNSQTELRLRCPGCRQRGVFENPANASDILIDAQHRIVGGQRRCPDLDCRTHIFFLYSENEGQTLATYPAELIEFDASDVPEAVAATLEEAISCHANENYIASAIMIRRTLEELCQEKEAEGPNLYEKITALRENVVLPEALFKGLHSLRLLGNDAAHVEARTYNEIGKTEVEVSLDVTKEVLKAVYQLEGLVSRLEALEALKADETEGQE